MIFVTVGSAPHSFKRLIQKMDEIASMIDNEVVIQKGLSSYQPTNTKCFDFVDYDVAMNYFKDKNGYRLLKINGEQSIQDVFEEIKKKINF